MPQSPHYNWDKIPLGDPDYPQTHSNLVDQIDNEVYRVEQGASASQTVVTTTDGLESAFTNASAGETILITGENAPYRTSQYLDIDVSGVTVLGRGAFPLVKPADGANVGGIRVGEHGHVEDILISGFSYHGNPTGQTANEGGFGVGLRDVENAIVTNCRFERTWPFHEHNQNNSGIMVYGSANGYKLTQNYFENIGDRAVTTFGVNGQIVANHSKDGYDRMVAITGANKPWSTGEGQATLVANNLLEHNQNGSVIGVGAPREDLLIVGNMAWGNHRCLVTLQGVFGGERHVLIAGNIGINDGQPADPSQGNHFPGIRANYEATTVIGNYLKGYAGYGIRLGNPDTSRGNRHHITVQNNRCMDNFKSGIRIEETAIDAVVSDNVLQNNCTAEPTQSEIDNRGDGTLIDSNKILSTAGADPGSDNAGGWAYWKDNISRTGGAIRGFDTQSVFEGNLPAPFVDVRNYAGEKGVIAYHDPDAAGDTNPEGPAFNDGNSWISLVDGQPIN